MPRKKLGKYYIINLIQIIDVSPNSQTPEQPAALCSCTWSFVRQIVGMDRGTMSPGRRHIMGYPCSAQVCGRVGVVCTCHYVFIGEKSLESD